MNIIHNNERNSQGSMKLFIVNIIEIKSDASYTRTNKQY